MQQDRGLYAPLIVEDPKEPLAYDKEWVVVLDDWVDGVEGSTPDAVLKELSGGMGGGMDHGAHTMSGHGDAAESGPTEADGGGPSRMMMGATSELLGGDAGDVAYPHYLVNGRLPEDPEVFSARPGDRVRLRIINAGGDTAFRVALGGHRMTVTHTDGFPVRHTTGDALLLGMGERYDVLVTAGDGVFPLTALAEGKKASALAVLRTGSGAAPAASVRPKELDGKLVEAGRLARTRRSRWAAGRRTGRSGCGSPAGWRSTTGASTGGRTTRRSGGRWRRASGCGSSSTTRRPCGIRSICTGTPSRSAVTPPGPARTPQSCCRTGR